MKVVEVISAFCIGGGRDVHEGTILKMDDRTARVKIQQGYVKLAEGEAPPASLERVTVEVVKPSKIEVVSEPGSEDVSEAETAEIKVEAKHPEAGDPETITSRDPQEPAAGQRRRGGK